MAVVEMAQVHKRFGRFEALRGVDLVVEDGQVHGFLGPNGAGKSTTMRILLGLLRADAGQGAVFGMDPWDDRVAIHRRLAVVPGDVGLWPQLTGGEAIDALTRLRGARPPAADRERLLEAFDLDPAKRIRTYSRGNRQKVALVAALATPAELYLFDEPTSGLDPLMEQVFVDQVRALRDRGATVLLSSHVLSEVERLCDQVSIIKDGQIVESGPLAQLRHLRRTEVRWTGPKGPARTWVDEDQLPTLLAGLAAVRATQVSVQPTSLESMFLHHYGGVQGTDDWPTGVPDDLVAAAGHGTVVQNNAGGLQSEAEAFGRPPEQHVGESEPEPEPVVEGPRPRRGLPVEDEQ